MAFHRVLILANPSNSNEQTNYDNSKLEVGKTMAPKYLQHLGHVGRIKHFVMERRKMSIRLKSCV